MKVIRWPGGTSQWLHDFSRAPLPWLSSVSWFYPSGVSAPVLSDRWWTGWGTSGFTPFHKGKWGPSFPKLFLHVWKPCSITENLIRLPWHLGYEVPLPTHYSRHPRSPPVSHKLSFPFPAPHEPTLICHNPESLQQTLSLNLPPSPLGKHFLFLETWFSKHLFCVTFQVPPVQGLLFPGGLDPPTASRDTMRPYFYLLPTGPELL